MQHVSWIEDVTDETLSVRVDTAVYSLGALFRVCYKFTDTCYLYLQPINETSVIRVWFSKKGPNTNLAGIAAEFSNELINQRVRMDIAAETHAVRELIIAQAFAESNLLDSSLSESTYLDDPKGIAQ